MAILNGALPSLRQGKFALAHTWLDKALSLLQQNTRFLRSLKKRPHMTLAILPSTEETPIWPENIFRIAWSERVGSTVSIGYAKARLDYLALHLADLAKAGDYLRQALIIFCEFGHTYGMAVTLDWLASLAAVKSCWEKAAWLFAYTAKQYEQILGLRPPVEQKDVEKDLALIRTQLGQAEWARLSEQLHTAVHQPLGDKIATISRAQGSLTFPASFQLTSATLSFVAIFSVRSSFIPGYLTYG